MTAMDRCEPAGLSYTGTTDTGGQPQRRAGRVVVLDPADRVLLLRYDEAPPAGPAGLAALIRGLPAAL